MPATHPIDQVSRGDRGAIIVFLVVGVAIILFAWFQTAVQIVAMFGDGPHSVPVIVPDGAAVSVEVGTGAVLTMTDAAGVIQVDVLPTAALVVGVAATLLAAITTTVVAGCLIALAVSILRGSIFSRRNTLLVVTAGITGLVGCALTMLANSILANEALTSVAGEGIASGVLTFDPLVFLISGFTVAVVATAFGVGARLQRETEGLV